MVEAEILRQYGSPVSFDPSFPTSQFFLVISFGRCKLKLSENSTSLILQSVIGGVPENFRVLKLGERVFRFSVSSPAVGFHIYKLRSFECAHFKVFFNLWHGGGPNFRSEFRRWQAEEKAQWTVVGKKKAAAPPVAGILTGANAIPVNIQNSSRGPVAGLNTRLSSPSVSTRFNFGATAQPSVLNEFKGKA